MSDFHSYAHSHLDFFKKHGQCKTYKPGHLLVRREEDSPWMFFLESGFVKMMFTDELGNERILGFGVPGMTFTQSGSFYSLPHVELEFETYTQATAWIVPRKLFIEALETNPVMFKEWHERILQNHNLLIERVLYIGEKRPKTRVVGWLLAAARYYSVRQPDGSYLIELPINQDGIASFTHLSRESISRIMSELKQRGLVQIRNRFISIPDVEGLKGVLQER